MIRPLLMRLMRRPWRFILLVVIFGFALLTLTRTHRQEPPPQTAYYKKTTKSFFPPLKGAPAPDQDYCVNFPKDQLNRIQVVLKTGANEKEKTKAHLSTVTSCISNLLIVSDHEDRIGDHHVIDILAELPASYKEKNPDFSSYLEHQKAHAEGDIVDYHSGGWKLDRFKFLPMVDKAYEMNPKADWYIFLEPDIYFFWDTLFRLLDQLKPEEMHYMGAPGPASKSPDRNFAYGGAGFVLSQGLMKKLLPPSRSGGYEKLAHRYEDKIKSECCGDVVLAHAILNMTETKLEALYPTFSGEDLRQIRVDKDRWCVPLLSLHRVEPDQMEKLWRWERTRPYNTKPFVYSSLLAYTHSHLTKSPKLEWWDNLSEAPVPNDRPAHRNADSCGSECSKDANCLQWSYSQTVCRFANYIKLGNPVDEMNGGQGEFHSGWDLKKMGELGFKVDEQSDIHDTCQEATWLTPKVRQ
ncbi:uncharacterized protein EI97DRAFT_216958 [Westerdykella ornata]|uniref:N-acetylgalactosaminide beta-1,3-galactosyltransferase n=1 Tax=Westerdykella ornata TaxID=318751 RepID=A0A6A6JR22_WESOR|nr:uncharacterized protein EI97DRAFT_216958 [Westerdykella ornata]KAF2278694.1 hypothetical protein EI97DRAFT_216958 [Westerdykella ornata]